jgi:hypothetical protein
MFLYALIIALGALLPTGEPEGKLPLQCGAWKAEAPALVFEGTQLYTFMDGGAEIYLEYGFERLESQSYQRGDDEIAVELYRLRDSYGMFTFLRPAQAEKLALGDAAFLSGYYVVLVKGPFLCAVTAQSEFPSRHDALVEVAGVIASRLDGAARRPEILGLLPVAGRIESTEKALRGPIGLRNVSTRAAELFSGFINGAAASYQPDCVGGVLVWDTRELADQAWTRALSQLNSEGGSGAQTAGELRYRDGPAAFLATRTGTFVLFATGVDRRKVDELIGGLKSSVADDGPIPGKGEEE